jgi:hypothetical protein
MPVTAWRVACGGYGYPFGMIVFLETHRADGDHHEHGAQEL